MKANFEIDETSLQTEVARRIALARAVGAPVCYIENGVLVIENQSPPERAKPGSLVSA